MNNTMYPIETSPFYRLQNKRKLEQLLYLPKYCLDKTEALISYYGFKQPKSDGSMRDITAPREKLKKIQYRIFSLLGRIERPEWLISGLKGKSYIDNARYHQLSKFVLTVDICKFYPSCKREYAFNFFHRVLEMSKDVAAVLADLLTLNNKIPTGCPTSQLMAYYSYKDMFSKINEVASRYGCIFSLYVDDMTFSSENSFDCKKLLRDIKRILHMYDHKAKDSKMKFYTKNENKLITGVIVTPSHTLIVPNKLRSKISKNKDFLINNPKGLKADKTRRTLRGQLVCARTIEQSIFPELYRAVSSGSI